MVDPKTLISPVLELAHAAGREIMQVYAHDFAVQEKADASPLTEADLRSQRTILAGLARLTPSIPVLAEESAAVPYDERRHWSEFWLVDPLDGTREFVSRNPEFTVNIALIRDHRPVLGVVHVPVKSLDYYGFHNGGTEPGSEEPCSFRRELGLEPQPIRVCTPARRPLRVVGSKSHRGDSLDKLLPLLGEHEIVPVGSSLKQCLVAEGSADFYPRLSPTMEWDTAAAHAVLECAGGRVVDLEGRDLLYNTREDLTNPHFLAFADTRIDWLGYVRAARAQ